MYILSVRLALVREKQNPIMSLALTRKMPAATGHWLKPEAIRVTVFVLVPLSVQLLLLSVPDGCPSLIRVWLEQ